MADDKTFTETEHIAILADRVSKETAELTATVDQLTTVKSELETRLDVIESEKVAAETRAKEAEDELAAFKAGLEELREAASRQETRVAKLREVAAHLPDEWYEAEGRLERICAMDDATFDGYAADLGTTNTGVAPKVQPVPRETAMQGKPPVVPGASTETNARSFLLRRYEKVEGA